MGIFDAFKPNRSKALTHTLNQAATRKSTALTAFVLNATTSKDGKLRFPVEVKGESHYQPALRKAAGHPKAYVQVQKQAALVPEPNNRHDENAIRVVIDSHLVGYLNAVDAEEYQPVFRTLAQRGQVGACQAMIYGGGDKSFGVWLSLAAPNKAL